MRFGIATHFADGVMGEGRFPALIDRVPTAVNDRFVMSVGPGGLRSRGRVVAAGQSGSAGWIVLPMAVSAGAGRTRPRRSPMERKACGGGSAVETPTWSIDGVNSMGYTGLWLFMPAIHARWPC